MFVVHPAPSGDPSPEALTMKLDLRRSTELELSELARPGLHIENDAEGEGFGALQMFAASMALCTASVLHHYAHHVLQVGVEGLRLTVAWDYADKPSRVGRLEMLVSWPELPEDRREAARRAAETCTLHNTLERPPEVVTRVA